MFLTAKEVADFLKLSESTIYKLVSKGEIPGFKIGDSWRFEMEEIQKSIQIKKNTSKEKLHKKSSPNRLP
jgi:excisionase family DNA binding protein